MSSFDSYYKEGESATVIEVSLRERVRDIQR